MTPALLSRGTTPGAPGQGQYGQIMCRSIKTLRPPYAEQVTDEDIQAAALQYVRKISGFRAPAGHNAEAFGHAASARRARLMEPASSGPASR